MPAVPRGGRRTVGTRGILIALVGAIVIVTLLAPQPGSEGGGYSARSADPYGVRVVYDLTRHLGWSVAQRDSELTGASAPRVVNVVLEPGDLDAREAHWLMESVRLGGALLIAGEEGAVADSIGYGLDRTGDLQETGNGCPQRHDAPRPSIADGATLLTVEAMSPGIVWHRPPPSPPTEFATIHVRRTRNDSTGRIMPAMVGLTLGRGRVVIAASGDLMANDVVRVCQRGADVAFVRALEFLAARDGAGPRDSLVFDEYHHGFGAHPGSLRAVAHYVTSTQSGHALGSAAVAALLLLIAASPRPIAPRDPERIVRRSPLEQADALANAYERVRATRTIVARLLSGVRRRAGGARGAQRLDDVAFLKFVAGAYPAVSADCDAVRRGLAERIAARELGGVAASLDRIEDAITRSSFLSPTKRTGDAPPPASATRAWSLGAHSPTSS